MNKKFFFEISVTAGFVLISTLLVYKKLITVASFWNAQSMWNIALAIGWIIVASGYYHQGSLIRMRKSSEGVSAFLPIAVFFIQCVLFVKGVFYKDWSLIWGALVVNSGVVFNLYQIFTVKKKIFF